MTDLWTYLEFGWRNDQMHESTSERENGQTNERANYRITERTNE